MRGHGQRPNGNKEQNTAGAATVQNRGAERAATYAGSELCVGGAVQAGGALLERGARLQDLAQVLGLRVGCGVRQELCSHAGVPSDTQPHSQLPRRQGCVTHAHPLPHSQQVSQQGGPCKPRHGSMLRQQPTFFMSLRKGIHALGQGHNLCLLQASRGAPGGRAESNAACRRLMLVCVRGFRRMRAGLHATAARGMRKQAVGGPAAGNKESKHPPRPW